MASPSECMMISPGLMNWRTCVSPTLDMNEDCIQSIEGASEPETGPV